MSVRIGSILLVVLALTGCASYVTPGGPATLSNLGTPGINEIMAQQPAAEFPARLAIARVQASGYRSLRGNAYGAGRYSVVLTRDIEDAADFERIARMPGVAAVGPLNRILLPTRLETLEDLREAAARLKADILLIYTFDTTFQAGEQKFLPLNTIALGFLKNKKVTVTTTASAALFDVRTEFLYGVAEATAQDSKRASVWSEASAVDDLRVQTEKNAFASLVVELETTWKDILVEYGYQVP